MDASFGRSVLKAIRDLGVQALAIGLASALAVAQDPALTAAVARQVPAWLVGLLPVLFVVARITQDQIKHRPYVGLDEER